MSTRSRRLAITVSAGITLSWSLVSLLLLYAAGMGALRLIVDALSDAGRTAATAVTVVGIAAATGIISITGLWLFGGPALHALEVWQADRLAEHPATAWPPPAFSDRWLRLARFATLFLLPAALALLFLAPD